MTVIVLTGFTAAFVTTFAATPVARRLALRTGALDRPRDGKCHRVPTPYLGGLAILAGIAIGATGAGAWRELAGIAFGALILATTGLIDDLRPLRPSVRVGVQAVAAALAVSAGVRASPLGIDVLDIVVTFLWILGFTNAFNLMDNMDGLTAGYSALASSLLFGVAAVSGQQLVAALAAAIAGAALGFLPHNFPRARIFMGDAGSLLLGFLVAVLALKVRFPAPRPWSFLAAASVLAIAVVDTSTVIVDRVWSGRAVARGGTDHLSHRLVALGLSRQAAVLVLLSAGATLGAVGVLGGLQVLPPAALVIACAAAGIAGVGLLRIEVAAKAPSSSADAGSTSSRTGPPALDVASPGFAVLPGTARLEVSRRRRIGKQDVLR